MQKTELTVLATTAVSTQKVDALIVRRLSAKLVSLATRKPVAGSSEMKQVHLSTQGLVKIFVSQLDHLVCSGSNAVMT